MAPYHLQSSLAFESEQEIGELHENIAPWYNAESGFLFRSAVMQNDENNSPRKGKPQIAHSCSIPWHDIQILNKVMN